MAFKSWFSNLLLFDNEDILLSYEGALVALATKLGSPISLVLLMLVFSVADAVKSLLLFPAPFILIVGSIFLTTAVTVL